MGLPLNISNLAFNLTITAAAAAAAPAAGRPLAGATPVTVHSHILEGYVYSNTPRTGGAQLQPLADNITSTTSGIAELFLQKNDVGSSILTLSVPDFSMHFLSLNNRGCSWQALEWKPQILLLGPSHSFWHCQLPKGLRRFWPLCCGQQQQQQNELNSSSSRKQCICLRV